MATLQSIRKHGAFLVIVIGIALFAFIAGDAWQALQSNQNAQHVGKINGKKIEAQAYQQLLEEYTQAISFVRGTSSLTEAENAQIKDEVWNTLVSNSIIEDEAKKLGLTVTVAELQAVINEGTDPLLAQSAFRNQAKWQHYNQSENTEHSWSSSSELLCLPSSQAMHGKHSNPIRTHST